MVITTLRLAVAYVDSSAVVAVALDEPNAGAVANQLSNFQLLISSNLLEAEVHSAFAREGRDPEPGSLRDMEWVLPTRPLHLEVAAVLEVGYLRGVDLWHVANALYAARTMPGLAFITLDQRQQTVAAGLGFPIRNQLPLRLRAFASLR